MTTITIIGCGLIGGSFAGLVKQHHPNTHITGIGRQIDPLVDAVNHQLIDAYDTTLSPTVISASDLVVIASPISTVIPIINQLTATIAKPLTIVEFSSVKSFLNDPSLLKSHHTIVPMHPMGGRDVQGLRHADPTILANCPLIIFDPSPPYLSFFKSCSFVPIVCPSYAQHDEWMAHVSHGPYLLATLLPSLLSQSPPDYLDALRRISAGGFRDTTRVANSPVEWGLDIVQGNQSALLSFLSDIEAQIATLKTVIQSGDSTALANHLKLAKQTRARIADSPTAI